MPTRRRSLLDEALAGPAGSHRTTSRTRSRHGQFVDDGHPLDDGHGTAHAAGAPGGWATFAASDAGPYRIEEFATDEPGRDEPQPAGAVAVPQPALHQEPPGDEDVDADLEVIRSESGATRGSPVLAQDVADDAVEFLREVRTKAPRPEAASRAPTGTPPSDDDRASPPGPADPPHPHEIFERMGRNMAYSTSFDLGDVSLGRRFDLFDQELASDETPVPPVSTAAALSEEDVDADVASIIAAPGPVPTAPPDGTADAPEDRVEATPPDETEGAPEDPGEASPAATTAEEGQDMSNRLAELEREITRQRDREKHDRDVPPGKGPGARLAVPGPPSGQDGSRRAETGTPGTVAQAMAPVADFDAARRRAMEAAREAGATDEDLREFFGVDVPAAAAGYVGALGRTELTLPSPVWLDGWRNTALETLVAATPLGALLPLARLAAGRMNATVGLGLVATVGLGSGGSFGAGVLVDARGLGYYGSQAVVMGWIASMTASIQLTVVKGDRSAFGGRAVAQSISLDLSEGPNVGASAIYTTSGRFLGVSATVGLSVGVPVLSAVEAYVEQQYTVAHGLAAVPDAATFAAGALSVAMANDIPLDPGVGGRSVAEDALEVGDILLSTGSGAVSSAIRAATDSEVSHAALYIGNGEIVEAVGGGVERKTVEQAMADDTFVVAVRREGLTDQQRDAIRRFAVGAIGRPYDNRAIINQAQFKILPSICNALPAGATQLACRAYRGIVRLGPTTNDRFICSELVLRAYEAAGVPLTSTDPEWGTPQALVDLHLAALLAYVGHLKTP